MLYVADRDGGTTATEPIVSVIRQFNMQTGAPAGEIRVDRSTGFNDIEVADDGTIYATQTGAGGQNPDPTTWQVWKITRDGTASIFVQGAPLRQPNGIAFDPQGNIVVINIGNNEVLTFSPARQLLKTENAVQPGNDGLVDHAGRDQVREQRAERRRVANPSRPAGGADRPEHPEPGVDVLRRRREPAGDSDEREQRARVHPAQLNGCLTICRVRLQADTADRDFGTSRRWRRTFRRGAAIVPRTGSRRRFRCSGRYYCCRCSGLTRSSQHSARMRRCRRSAGLTRSGPTRCCDN